MKLKNKLVLLIGVTALMIFVFWLFLVVTAIKESLDPLLMS